MISTTSLQDTILSQLVYDEPPEIGGRELRDKLNNRWRAARWWRRWWNHVSVAKFYLTMSQLEDAGLVCGWYEPEEIDGHVVKLRWYRCRRQAVAHLWRGGNGR